MLNILRTFRKYIVADGADCYIDAPKEIECQLYKEQQQAA